VAHRGRLLKSDLDAAAGGVFDGLLGLVIEAVVLQAATGRPHKEVMWVREHALTLPSDRRGRGGRWREASRIWKWLTGVCVQVQEGLD
jgi:hypothetical protein